MRYTHLEHRFVEQLPERLEPSVLYICMEYATSAHSCCCGCGEEVVTPFTPTDWKMTFDGETVSLSPSIGNWNFTCRSHYFIRRGQVIEAATWTDKQVEDNRRMDRSVKAQYYGTIDLTETSKPALVTTPQTATSDLVLELKKWIHRKWNKLTQKLDRWLKRS